MARRRQLLRLGATGLAAGIAGCSGETIPAGAGSTSDTGTPTYPAVLATAPIRTPTGTVTRTVARERVVVAGDLPAAESEIVSAAVTEGSYRSCQPPEAFGSLTQRFGDEGYLRFEDSLYGVYIAAADEVQVSTGSAGAPLPDC